MELDEYLPMFLAESREHLQELNLAIVSLEQTPDDSERVDQVFRIAHSLKGMSATMGFSRVAALTHEMEDVLELLRQRRGGLEREAIDTLLECLDALSGAVESIAETAEEGFEPDQLIQRLRALARGSDEPELRARAERLGAAVSVTVTLAEDVVMPAARAFMILAALAEHGDIVRSRPTEEDLDEFTGGVVEVGLDTPYEEAVLVGAVSDIEGVAQVRVEVAIAEDEVAAAPAPVADAEPEPTPTADVRAESGAAAEVTASAADAAPEPTPAAREPSRARRAASTVRVDSERLDLLMSAMGELVVHRTRLESLAARDTEVPGMQQALQDLTRSSQALRALVMQVRLIEVEAVFMRLPRLVRDLAKKLDKDVELRLSGADTELDRSVVDALGDPLVHLVRNALDHGFESPDERVAAGKPATGRLGISARHAGGSVVITVSDDGRGIDPAAVARKALQRGLIASTDEVDLPAAVELLFSPGFSTAEQTSDISGRGVGMDAVRSAVRSLGGDVSLTGELGCGTTAQIRLPLTLAIIAALVVQIDGRPFAIPLDRVEHTLRLADGAVRSAAGRRLLVVGDSVLPLCDGTDVLGRGEHAGVASHAVIVGAGEQRIALAVEELVGQRELVTRPLPPELEAGIPLSGGAVLSDGAIALIVDCDSLVGDMTRPPALTAA
jgi:two-component system chemotaxis sensor kinase CheA